MCHVTPGKFQFFKNETNSWMWCKPYQASSRIKTMCSCIIYINQLNSILTKFSRTSFVSSMLRVMWYLSDVALMYHKPFLKWKKKKNRFSTSLNNTSPCGNQKCMCLVNLIQWMVFPQIFSFTPEVYFKL